MCLKYGIVNNLNYKGVMIMTNYGAHPTHCCKWHGCKYGDPDCPVVTGKVKQVYLCEECYETLDLEDFYIRGIKEIEEIKEFIKERDNA